MRQIGYARVSSTHQSLDRQLGALRAERVDVIYREKVSGKATKGRPELEKAIDALGKGDILVVAEWDRATRSMFDGIHIIERINARGALIKVLDKPHLDLTTPLGRGFIAFLFAMAEDERHRILKRANDGRASARKRGVRFGRKPKLTDHQQAEALKRLAAGESCRAIGKTMGVHHATIARLAG
jgi:DNA invertase Pin-like site-specific DNA recombinase